MNSEAEKLTLTDIHPVQVYGHTAQGASMAQVNAMRRNLKKGSVLGKTQASTISTIAWFFGERRPPLLNKSASGSRCGGGSMSTQGADFVRSGGNLPAFWQRIPDTGTKRQVQSLPPFARCWRRAGSRAHQVSTPVPLWTELCSTRPSRHGKERLGTRSVQVRRRYHNRFCQDSQDSVDQREKCHGCAGTAFSSLWSHQRAPPACAWFYSQSAFLCALRSEDLGRQEARTVGMSR